MSTSPEPVAAPAAENPVGPAGAGVPAPPEAIAADDVRFDYFPPAKIGIGCVPAN